MVNGFVLKAAIAVANLLLLSLYGIAGCSTQETSSDGSNHQRKKINLKLPTSPTTEELLITNSDSSHNEWRLRLHEGPPRQRLKFTQEDQATVERSTVLDCRKYTMDDSFYSAIKQVDNIRWLILGEQFVRDDIEWVLKLKELRGLAVRNANDLNGVDISRIQSLSNLESISLRNVSFSCKEASELSFPNLESLAISGELLGDEHIELFAENTKLVALEVSWSSVTDDGIMQVLHNNSGIKSLELMHSRSISSKSISTIASLKNLRYLHLGGTRLAAEKFNDQIGTIVEIQKTLPNCYISCAVR